MFAAMIMANFLNWLIGGIGLKLFAKVLAIPESIPLLVVPEKSDFRALHEPVFR